MARTGAEEHPPTTDRPARLTGRSALRLHLTLAAGLFICVGAFCIEVIRALDGNTLSWAYVFEWPLFAAFGIYLWWNLLNGKDRHHRGPDEAVTPQKGESGTDGEQDEDLAAWNRYLRQLEANEAEEQDRAG